MSKLITKSIKPSASNAANGVITFGQRRDGVPVQCLLIVPLAEMEEIVEGLSLTVGEEAVLPQWALDELVSELTLPIVGASAKRR